MAKKKEKEISNMEAIDSRIWAPPPSTVKQKIFVFINQAGDGIENLELVLNDKEFVIKGNIKQIAPFDPLDFVK